MPSSAQADGKQTCKQTTARGAPCKGRARPSGYCLFHDPELAGELADHVLRGCDEQPAWASLRHYDAPLIDALRRRGFSTLLNQGLLVRDTAVREPAADQALVPSFG